MPGATGPFPLRGPVFRQASPSFLTWWPRGVGEVARPLKGRARESRDVTPSALHLWGDPRSRGPGPEPTAHPDGCEGASERREGVWPPVARRFPIRLFPYLSDVVMFLRTRLVFLRKCVVRRSVSSVAHVRRVSSSVPYVSVCPRGGAGPHPPAAWTCDGPRALVFLVTKPLNSDLDSLLL